MVESSRAPTSTAGPLSKASKTNRLFKSKSSNYRSSKLARWEVAPRLNFKAPPVIPITQTLI